MKNLSKVFVFILFFLSSQGFTKVVREGYLVLDPGARYLELFAGQPVLTIDHKMGQSYEVYGPEGTGEYLKDFDIITLELDHLEEAPFNQYPSPEAIEDALKTLVAEHSDIMKLESIGTSVEGRALWVVKVSDNVEQNEREPEVKYIANMHGNEIVGRELMIKLLFDMAERYRAGDENVVDLINKTEIFIMPSMNPDGANRRRRGNARWVDLNRDFPDFTTGDTQNNPLGRAPETQAVMKFQKQHQFSLSANFHGGTMCVNYPWDTTDERFPQHDHVVALSRAYANRVTGMRESREFPGGITNGYDWYEVNGGMQDWSFNWHDDLQVTIELSHQKWPPYSEVEEHWQENRESLYSYLRSVHQGVGFYFEDAPVMRGRVQIVNLDNGKMTTHPFHRGEFYRVLKAGRYQLKIIPNGRSERVLGIELTAPRSGRIVPKMRALRLTE